MNESRQQRRARERRDAKDAIRERVTTSITNARSVQAMWQTFYKEVLVPRRVTVETLPEGVLFTEKAFYAGAAAMLELMMRVSPDHISEDQGVEMLQRVYEELQTHAARIGGPDVERS